MRHNQSLNILKFIRKFFFILKAASEGWIVNCVGTNKFEFYKRKNEKLCSDSMSSFIKNYTCNKV
jgi:hypothetical protein